jgi:hypothetical protein
MAPVYYCAFEINIFYFFWRLFYMGLSSVGDVSLYPLHTRWIDVVYGVAVKRTRKAVTFRVYIYLSYEILRPMKFSSDL